MRNFMLFALVLAGGLCEASVRLHCRWEPSDRPGTYLQYNRVSKFATVVYLGQDPNCRASNGRYSDTSGNLDPSSGGAYPTPSYYSCRRIYGGVQMVRGLPDAGPGGFSLAAFDGDVVISHHLGPFWGKTWYELDTSYPMEAYFNSSFPGSPDPVGAWARTRGVCWTGSVPPVKDAQP